jgi:hypothetical protein
MAEDYTTLAGILVIAARMEKRLLRTEGCSLNSFDEQIFRA